MVDHPALCAGRRDTPCGIPILGTSSRTPRASRVMPDPDSRPFPGTGGAGRPSATARPDDTPSAHSPAVPGSGERQGCGVCPGLKVSLRQLLQRGLFQLRLGQQPLQRGVLLLEFLESFRVVGFQPTVLVPPPVVRLLAHAELATYRRDIGAISEQPAGPSLRTTCSGV